MEKLIGLLKSRKFWAALVGLAVIVIKEFEPDFPLEEEQITNIVFVIAAYIVGTAIEDGRSSFALMVSDKDLQEEHEQAA